MTWQPETMRGIRLLAGLLAVLAAGMVAGCGATEPQPVGIGRGADDLKRSPCACLDHPVAPPSQHYLDELDAWASQA